MNPTTQKLLGALVAAGLAFAVYYGLIGQQTASSIQNQANQTLGTTPAGTAPGQTTTGQTTTGQTTAGAPANTSVPNATTTNATVPDGKAAPAPR